MNHSRGLIESFQKNFSLLPPVFFSFLFFFLHRVALTRKRGEILSPLLSSPQLEYPPNISTTFLPTNDRRFTETSEFSSRKYSRIIMRRHFVEWIPPLPPPPPSLFFQVPTTVQGESKPGILGVVIRRVCESNEPRLPARNFSILTSPFSLSLAARRTKEKNGFRRFLFEE